MRLSTTFSLVLVFTSAAAAQVRVAGRVIDEAGAPVPAARVAVHCGAAPAVGAQTGPAGDFELSLLPGDCTLNVDHAGFFELRDRPLHIGNGPTEVTVTLNPQHEVFQSVTVGALPAPAPFNPKPAPTSSTPPLPTSFPAWTSTPACASAIGPRAPASPDLSS